MYTTVAIKRHLSRQSADAPRQDDHKVERVYLLGHSFEVSQVLYRDLNGTVWGLASLIDLAHWGNLVVLAIGPDWFEVPAQHGNFFVPQHGLGSTGELLFLDWRVDGKLTLEEPKNGAFRCYICRVVDDDNIEWNADVYYEIA